MAQQRVDVERLDQWKPGKGARHPVTAAQIADSEALYQVMMLARTSREMSWRVFRLRGHSLPWAEILADLTAEGE